MYKCICRINPSSLLTVLPGTKSWVHARDPTDHTIPFPTPTSNFAKGRPETGHLLTLPVISLSLQKAPIYNISLFIHPKLSYPTSSHWSGYSPRAHPLPQERLSNICRELFLSVEGPTRRPFTPSRTEGYSAHRSQSLVHSNHRSLQAGQRASTPYTSVDVPSLSFSIFIGEK